MNPSLQIAIFNMVANVGIEATVAILNGMKNASSIEDAIKALQAAQLIKWSDFKEKQQ
jgi:hypothetical protein